MTPRRAPLRPDSDHHHDYSVSVLTVRPGRRHVVATLGPSVAIWTHWIATDRGGRTRPCVAPDCPHCITHRRIWRAYAPGAMLHVGLDGVMDWRRVVIPITQGIAWLAGEEHIGCPYILSRRREAKNSPIECVPWDGRVQKQLPPAFDLSPILGRVWGVEMSPLTEDEHPSLYCSEFGELDP